MGRDEDVPSSLGPNGDALTAMLPGAARYFSSRIAMTALFGVVLFVAAGQLDWSRAWLYLGVVVVGETLSEASLLILNPGVLNQRGTTMRPDTEPFDRAFIVLWPVGGFAAAAVAGLDVGRFGWSALPFEAVYPGIVLTVVGYAIGTWAMAVNAYFEPTVRIQGERDHQVVTTGPYRFVRHPGYVGALLGALAAPLVLGSAWMFLPAAGIVLLFAARTALEDRTLQSGLPGYREYARNTPYRLLPGVW
jgi:protein-S-isoprenylcysteine O-methyltransferase Ste14